MKHDARLLDAVEMIAASTWATEAVLRALERGEVESAAKLLEDARRSLRHGLRDLRRALDDQPGEALADVVRLQELIEARAS